MAMARILYKQILKGYITLNDVHEKWSRWYAEVEKMLGE